MRSRATICCLLALSVVACDRLVPFSREKKAETPPAWRGVLVAEVGLPEQGAPAVETLSQLLERAWSLPGVRLAAVTDTLPGTPDTRKSGDIFVEGRPSPGTGHVRTISADYFRVMEIPLHRGRQFVGSDREGSPSIAIVNEAFARQEWPGEDPLGRRIKRIRTVAPDLWLTVVGIVQDTPRAEGVPEIYLPYTQAPDETSWYLLVRTVAEAEPTSLTAGLHESLRSGALDLRLGELRGLEEILQTSR